MQCEALLDAELATPMIADAAEDVYDALRFGISDHFAATLWAHWRDVQETEAWSVNDLIEEDATDRVDADANGARMTSAD